MSGSPGFKISVFFLCGISLDDSVSALSSKACPHSDYCDSYEGFLRVMGSGKLPEEQHIFMGFYFHVADVGVTS